MGTGTATGVARAVAITPETRDLCSREFLVMNTTLFLPALTLRHRPSLDDRRSPTGSNQIVANTMTV
jgi:hypothetical protein